MDGTTNMLANATTSKQTIASQVDFLDKQLSDLSMVLNPILKQEPREDTQIAQMVSSPIAIRLQSLNHALSILLNEIEL